MSFTPELLKLSLQRAIRVRWKATFRRLRITFLLPLVIAAVLSLIFYLMEYRYELFDIGPPPAYLPKPRFWLPIILVIPPLLVVTMANLVLFLKTIPSIYTDKWKGKKERILFIPEPYTIDEAVQTEAMQKFYIKTNVHEFPFFEVDFNSYMACTMIDYLILELTPITRILLGIRTKDNENILTL
jgi:hypothetical protein